MSVAEIAFDCPHCHAPFVVDATAAGMETQCPDCSKMITVPMRSEVFTDPPSNTQAPPSSPSPASTPSYPSHSAAQSASASASSQAEAASTNPELTQHSSSSSAQASSERKLPTSRSFADKSPLPSAAQKTSSQPASNPASVRQSAGGLPLQRNRGHRDLSSVAKGQTAGRVEQIRGGWRGYCPECGDVFLFSKGDAQRGAELQCTRCFCDIRIHEGDPPRLETVRTESPARKKERQKALPSGTQARNVQATMEHAQMDARQSRQAKDRAIQVSAGKDRYLWLRILVLIILLGVAFLLIRALQNRAAEQESEAENAKLILSSPAAAHS